MHKTLINLLLSCALLTILAAPHVASQSVTTSYQYSTTSLTSTISSTISTSTQMWMPAQFDLTPGDYDYRTGTFSLSYTEASGARLFQNLQDYPCLFYDYFLLSAKSGHTIHFRIQLSMPERGVDLLILTPSQFWEFQHSNCGWGLKSSILEGIVSFSTVDWIVPATGQYAVVFATPIFYGGQIYCSAQDSFTTVQTAVTASTVTSTFEVTNTVLSTQPSTQSPTTSLSSETSSLIWLPVIVILILLVLIGIVLVARKRR